MDLTNYHLLVKEAESKGAKLIAVSKTKPASKIMELYEAGQRIFGENRVQELLEKQEALPKDIQWHLIGHLQRNKVKFIAPFVDMIHSVDSLRLLNEINKQAAAQGRKIKVLLQFHIAEEDSKFGLDLEEAKQMLEGDYASNYPFVTFCGVMGMATFTDDLGQVRREFEGLYSIKEALKRTYFSECKDFCETSMGMSGDYQLALDCGSTMIRVGSLLFGAR